MSDPGVSRTASHRVLLSRGIAFFLFGVFIVLLALNTGVSGVLLDHQARQQDRVDCQQDYISVLSAALVLDNSLTDGQEAASAVVNEVLEHNSASSQAVVAARAKYAGEIQQIEAQRRAHPSPAAPDC